MRKKKIEGKPRHSVVKKKIEGKSAAAKKKLGAALGAAVLLAAVPGGADARAEQPAPAAAPAVFGAAGEAPAGRQTAPVFEARPAEDDYADSGTWNFAKEIQAAPGSQYQALFLDADVYARAGENLNDVRIVDSTGRFVPYYADSGEEGERGLDRQYPLELVDRAKSKSATRFDFRVVPASGSEDVRGSRLTFPLSQSSFLKTVRVQGSYDGQLWEDLTEGELYSTGEGIFRNVIELEEPVKYGYYRLIAPNGEEPLALTEGTLTDVGAAVSGERFRRTAELPFNVQPSARMSEVVLYNADKLRIDRIRLNASASDGSSSFSRLFYVNRAKGTGANTRVLSPTRLNRLELDGESVDDTEIRLAEPIRNEKPMIVIDNAGNLPLNIESIEAGYRVDRLVFEDTGAGPYRLVYGAERQPPPRYDLAAFRTEIERSKPAEAALGPENAARFVPPAPGTDGADPAPKVGAGASLQILFNVVLVGVALLLIVLVSRKLRKK